MQEPDHTPLGARLRERTQPMAPDDAANGYGHAYLCEGIGRMGEQVAEVFDPEGDVPPLAPILDSDLCPDWALPWLAQWVGVQLPQGATPDQARSLIKNVSGFKRGTPAALRAAAQFFLTGNKTVYFRERYQGNAYSLEVVTLTSETPNPAQVQAAILAQKPGGIVLDYHTVTGWDYDTMTETSTTYAVQSTHFATYQDLRDNAPTS